MKYIISFLAIIVFALTSSYAGGTLTPEQQYEKASRLYKSGNYAEACMQYQNLVNDGKQIGRAHV